MAGSGLIEVPNQVTEQEVSQFVPLQGNHPYSSVARHFDSSGFFREPLRTLREEHSGCLI